LIASTLALWAIAFFPARYLEGRAGVIYSLIALGLCLVPTSLTLFWASQPQGSSVQRQLLLVFGGTGLRMGFVLGGGLLLGALLPFFRETAFWIWLLVFYLFTLTLEAVLMRDGQRLAEHGNGDRT
jgi:hypothetical protein